MQITIIGSSEECHDMLDRLSQNDTEIGVLDDIRADYMLLHQRVNKLQKSIPDPVKMWEALEDKKRRKK